MFGCFSMSELVTELGRSFIREASKELRIYDRYVRFVRYWRGVNRVGRCVDADVILHHVDNVFIPILENTNQLAVAVDNNAVPRYYRNRFTRALNTRDKGFVRWFLKNYVINSYTDVDALVSNNYPLLPWVFGYGFCVCPITGGTCANNANYSCVSITILPQTGVCCTSSDACNGSNYFILVDNAPWVSNYSTNAFGITTQVPTSSGTFTLTGSVTGPSCFPSSGVTLNLDIINAYNGYRATCASSCPSDSVCGAAAIPYCPGNTQSYAYIPILYYGINLTVLPNSSYSVWWQASVS